MSRPDRFPWRLAVTFGVAAVIGLGGCVDGAGPVGSPERNRLGLSVPAKTPFTYGIPVVFNEGARAAILEKVELDDPTPGFRLVSQEIAGPDRNYGAVAGDRAYPPRHPRPGDLHPLPGFVLQPTSEKDGEHGAEIVLALQTPGPGIYRFQGLRLTYRVGDRRYTSVIPHALRACAISDHEGRGVREWPRCLANRKYT